MDLNLQAGLGAIKNPFYLNYMRSAQPLARKAASLIKNATLFWFLPRILTEFH